MVTSASVYHVFLENLAVSLPKESVVHNENKEFLAAFEAFHTALNFIKLCLQCSHKEGDICLIMHAYHPPPTQVTSL